MKMSLSEVLLHKIECMIKRACEGETVEVDLEFLSLLAGALDALIYMKGQLRQSSQ